MKRTRDLPDCNAVLEPSASPRAPRVRLASVKWLCYGLDHPAFEPRQRHEMFCSSEGPGWRWDPPFLQFSRYRSSFPDVKRPGREFEGMNEWSCTFTPSICVPMLVQEHLYPFFVFCFSQLMLYREIMAVCSEIHTKHITTVCGQNVELLNVKLVVHIVTTGL